MRGVGERKEGKGEGVEVTGRKREGWSLRQSLEKGVGERGVDEEWSELRERIRGAIGRSGKGGETVKKGGWWDRECREEKSKVRRELGKWRKEGGDGRKYKEMKREYGRLCEGKR